MSSSGDSAAFNLLRLLEPAVRPGNLPASAKPANTPIEQRSFESLLEEAQSLNVPSPAEPALADLTEMPAEGGEPAVKIPAGPLAQLGQIDRIDNPSLRRLISGERGE